MAAATADLVRLFSTARRGAERAIEPLNGEVSTDESASTNEYQVARSIVDHTAVARSEGRAGRASAGRTR